MGQGVWCWLIMVGVAIGGGLGSAARAGTIRGDVIAVDGTPATGAEVWVLDQRSHQSNRHAGVTDAAGRFTLEVGSGSWTVEARLGDQGPGEPPLPIVVGATDPAPVTIRLRPQSRLRARLVEAETGRPIVGGRLVLDNGLDPTTDADGRIEVRGLARRPYHEAIVLASGRERHRVFFELTDGPTTDLEVAIPRGVQVVGRVLDLAGTPIAGAWVGRNPFWVTVPGGLWVRADEQGRFEYDGLRPGRMTRLITEAEGFSSAEVEGIETHPDGRATTVEIRLARIPAATRQVEERRELAGVVVDRMASRSPPESSGSSIPAPRRKPMPRGGSGSLRVRTILGL